MKSDYVDVFYFPHGANNPEATGLEMMMKPTPEMTDEVVMNRMRIRMALDYIRDHPGRQRLRPLR